MKTHDAGAISAMDLRAVRNDPVIIGASGGSGTRVFARMARHAGIFMGLSLNKSEDSQPFIDFYDAWTPLYLKREGRLLAEEERAMEMSFLSAIKQHLVGLSPGSPWGIKNPRSLLFLPWWIQRYPRLKFIHVIRHGLDMAYSGNQREVQMYRALVLSREERAHYQNGRAIAYWSKVNLAAAEVGERQLQDRYLPVRFEELCTNPAQTVQRFLAFLGATDRSCLEAAVGEVAPPPTIGRWIYQPLPHVHELMKVGRRGLQHFGYWNAPLWVAIERAMEAPQWSRWIFRRCQLERLAQASGARILTRRER